MTRVSQRFECGSPLGGTLLEWIDHLAILAKLTDKALFTAQTAAVDMRRCKLNHFQQKGAELPINNLSNTMEIEERYSIRKQTYIHIGQVKDNIYFILQNYILIEHQLIKIQKPHAYSTKR